nr:ORF1 [Alternaria botybirnavirus 2]
MPFTLHLGSAMVANNDKQAYKKIRREQKRQAKLQAQLGADTPAKASPTLEGLPAELKVQIAKLLVTKKGSSLDFTSAKFFELCSPKLYGCAPKVSGAFFTSRGSDVEFITSSEIDYLSDLVVESGMYVSSTTVDPLWWRYGIRRGIGESVVTMNMRFLKRDRRSTAVEDKTAGVRPGDIRKNMPTTVETRGIRAVDAATERGSPAQTGSSTGTQISEALKQVVAAGPDALVVTSSDISEGSAYKDTSLTHVMMASFPSMQFKNPFLMQKPTSEPQDLYIAWGYGLKSITSSGRGAGYADKYSVKLWTPNVQLIPLYPAVHTAVGYQNKITRSRIQAMSGASVTTERPDVRDFLSRFDERKNLPTEFRLAGEAKAQDGDNHIAFLVLAQAGILALKQAMECGARATYKSSQNSVLSFGVDLAPYVTPMASTFSAAATALADAWFQSSRTVGKPDGSDPVTPAQNIYEMVLPSNAADANEVVYLAFLAGHLNNELQWVSKTKVLNMSPTALNIRSSVTKMLRIPLANAARHIPVNDVARFDGTIELGRAEAVFNSYVRRFDLSRQLETARAVLLLALTDRTSLSATNTLRGLPYPQHTVEYDLWVGEDRYADSVIGLVSASESANLLVAISQVQHTMRDDVLTAKMVSNLESKRLPVSSPQAVSSTSAWVSDEFPQGYSTWGRSYILSHMGIDDPEVRRLGNTNASDILIQLQQHLLTSDVRPTSLLYYGEKVTSGCLSLIWDESARRQLSSQRNVTGTQAAMLEFLFSGESDIFATPTTPWLSYVRDLSLRRSSRKIDSSLSVRTTNSVRGEPRIIYLGLKPDHTEYRARMDEAQTLGGIVSHYEPYFDLATAIPYMPVELDTGSKPADHRHDNERGRTTGKAPIPHARSRSASLVKMGINAAVAAGRVYTHINAAKKREISPPKKTSSHQRERELFSDENIGRIVIQEVSSRKHAASNGLSDSVADLHSDTLSRISAIPKNVANPASHKGSEILERSVESALAHAKLGYVYLDMEYSYCGMNARDYARVNDRTVLKTVEGDGRCGVRAIAASMHAEKYCVNSPLDKFFAIEAKVMGLKTTKRAPSEYQATDYVMAGIAHALGVSICIIHYEGNDSLSNKAFRFYRNKESQRGRVVFVMLKDDHYYGMEVDEEFRQALRTASARDAHQILCGDIVVESSDEDSDGEPEPVEDKKAGGKPSGHPSSESETTAPKDRKRSRKPKRGKYFSSRASTPPMRIPGSSSDIEMTTKPDPNYEEVETEAGLGPIGGYPRYKKSSVLDKQIARYAGHLLYTVDAKVAVNRLVVSGVYARVEAEFAMGTDTTRQEMYDILAHKTHVDIRKAILDLKNKIGSQVIWDETMRSDITSPELVYLACAVNIPIVIFYADRIPASYNMAIKSYVEVHGDRTNAVSGKTLNFLHCDGKMHTPWLTDHVESAMRTFRDIKNFAYRFASLPTSYDRSANARTISAKMAPISHQVWEEAIKGLINKRAPNTVSGVVTCDSAYFNRVFPSRGSWGNGDDDNSNHPLELLSVALLANFLPDQANWVRLSALDWLQSQVGWLPRDPTWYGIETAVLILLELDVRVWQISSPETNIYDMKETARARGNATLPIILGERDEHLIIHLNNTVLPATLSFNEVQKMCTHHRINGTHPGHPDHGPILPPNRAVNQIKYMSRTQAVLMGVGIGVTIAGGAVTSYIYRRPLMGLIKKARDHFVGVPRNIARGHLLRQAALDRGREWSEAEPFLNTDYLASSIRSPTRSVISEVLQAPLSEAEEFGRNTAPSLKTVNIDDYISGIELDGTVASTDLSFIAKVRAIFSGNPGSAIDHSDGL